MILSHDDPRLTWHGHISLERASEYTRPWRIPYSERELFFQGVINKAAEPSGVRLSCLTTATEVSGSILRHDEPRFLDLCVDGQFYARQALQNEETFAFRNLPKGEKLVELWLPQGGDFALKRLEMDNSASVRAFEDRRKRWITYGSSITQCRTAESPTQTWPSIIARERNLNLTNLGLSGECQLDPLIAQVIRDSKMDFLSICAGINIYIEGSLNARTFASGLIGFVRIIREKHPKTPLVVISPVYSESRETVPNSAGWTLQQYRMAVEDAVEILRKHGDSCVHYISGIDIFGENLTYLMPDGLHPSAEGYKMMGLRFLEKVAPVLFETARQP